MLDLLAGVPGKLKTLVDRITSARAANLDNLDAPVSDTAPAATALSSATWTSGLAAKLGNAIETSVIKSIQTGFVNAPGSTGSGEDVRYIDSTVSAVDPTKSVVLFMPSRVGASNDGGTARLTSTTNVRCAIANAVTVCGRWVVIEFK